MMLISRSNNAVMKVTTTKTATKALTMAISKTHSIDIKKSNFHTLHNFNYISNSSYNSYSSSSRKHYRYYSSFLLRNDSFNSFIMSMRR
jgi:hypothetical protein